LHKLLSGRSRRYLVVGGSVYLVELAVIFTAQRLGASAVVAVGLSFWVGLGMSFVLQKFITFRDKRLQRQVLVPQIAAFSALVLFNFGFTLLVAKLLAGIVPAAVSRTLALAITAFWNFYLYKTRLFKTSGGFVY